MYACEQAKGYKALFAVGEAVIFKREGHPFKNAHSICEVKAMGFDVRCALGF